MEIEFNSQVLLGRGGFGSVFPGTFQGRKVAIKRVELVNATDNEEEALKQLDHPNIVKLFHVDCNKDFKYFVLELCTASLDKIFLEPNDPQKYKGPKLPYHYEVFLQMALGLEYIHSKNLIHRDIKPENVLISVDTNRPDMKVTIKWADFGLSRAVNERGSYTMNSGVKGTKCWYAPEWLKLLYWPPTTRGQPRGTVKSDVFALGLVFAYLLLDGQHIYGSNEIDIVKNILEGRAINMNKIERSHYVYSLVTEMLKNEAERISSSNIVDRLKSERDKLAEKEKELFELCKIRHPATSIIFPWTNQNEKLKTLIRQGVDVNKKDNNGNNALHLLCRFNNSSERLIDAIKLLIQLGINVNEKNNNGNNALHFLCLNNSSERLIDAIKLLIQLGINVNEKTNYGNNALHFLCLNNSSERLIDAIKLLIQLGINVNEKTNNGSNALHFLCGNNSSERLIDAIKLLIQLGIDVNEKDKDGRNALHLLCRFNNSSERLIDAIKLLIQLGIEVSSSNVALIMIDVRSLLRKNETKNFNEIIKLFDEAFT
ncbi:serine/threonine-protein kinase/endoribonuclease IRE1-like isoform X2 [Daphnia pulicaria]|uniref:serine/threonine-protein kinase/endoribonuclease IRE1-like isoform X2 n=1 Tax=Daphnia pulicaria TaxID=35523 RepID=UPI001EEB1701|nr:serine/threonine-protein kinase/endoribonuclease IRE1-like isoform X2 [Daphnia pulicaria]